MKSGLFEVFGKRSLIMVVDRLRIFLFIHMSEFPLAVCLKAIG